MIKNILLGLLNYFPMSGYDLKRMIDESTAHFWHAHHSQIYTSLREMEKDGWVSSQFIKNESLPDRRVYTLTEEGKKVLKEWLDKPMIELPPIKDEFIVRIFFSANRDKEKIRSELIVQQQLHQEHLAEYHQLESHMTKEISENHPVLSRDAQFWQATLSMGKRYENAYLDWLAELIKLVDQE